MFREATLTHGDLSGRTGLASHAGMRSSYTRFLESKVSDPEVVSWCLF